MRLTIGLAAFFTPFVLVLAAAASPMPRPVIAHIIDQLAHTLTHPSSKAGHATTSLPLQGGGQAGVSDGAVGAIWSGGPDRGANA